MLRNRRTIVFALVFPAAMFLVFGSRGDSQKNVGAGNVSAYVMVSMALYGGALICGIHRRREWHSSELWAGRDSCDLNTAEPHRVHRRQELRRPGRWGGRHLGGQPHRPRPG